MIIVKKTENSLNAPKKGYVKKLYCHPRIKPVSFTTKCDTKAIDWMLPKIVEWHGEVVLVYKENKGETTLYNSFIPIQ